MEDKEDLVRNIFNSIAFKNVSQQEQREIIKQITATGEVSAAQVTALYNESQQASQLERLPYGVFANIILAGNLRGDDLLALCGSSPILQDYCNRPVVLPTGQEVSQYLFRQLIEKEKPGYIVGDQEQPREVYKDLTTKGIKDFTKLIVAIDQFNQEDYTMEEQIEPPKTIQALLYDDSDRQFELLFYHLTIDKDNPNLMDYYLIKHFLDTSLDPLLTAIHYISDAEIMEIMRMGNDWYQTIINGVRDIWQRTRSFPQVLLYLSNSTRGILNIPRLVEALKTYFDKGTTFTVAATIFQRYSVDEVLKLWENYEAYYLMCLNVLLPKDDMVLENRILNRLISIVDDYLDGANNRLNEIIQNGNQPNDEDNQPLLYLTETKSDLEKGAYRKVIRWLIGIHYGVLNRKYSIFSVVYPSRQ